VASGRVLIPPGASRPNRKARPLARPGLHEVLTGEGGIRTRGTGLTPYNGLANGGTKQATPHQNESCESAGNLSGRSVVHPAQEQGDLAELLSVWPTLPEPVKAGIVAMVEAAHVNDPPRPTPRLKATARPRPASSPRRG